MNRFTLCLLLLPALGVRLPAQAITWISACSDQTFCVDQGACTQGQVFMAEQAVSNCMFGSQVDYTYKIDLNNNGGIEVTSTNDTCSGSFPKGTHRIYWRASDQCGNVANCNYLFTVKDCTPPNLLCINGLTQNISSPECMSTFTPDQFVLSFSDNCTPNNQLQFGIREAGTGTGFPSTTSVTFNQCDIGLNFVEIWIKDANGLMNICQNYVLVQQNGSACVCNPDGEIGISGCARTSGNKKLSEYTVRSTVESLSGVQTPVNKTVTKLSTDSCYSLTTTHLPFGGQYRNTLRAERFGNPKEGVSTFDLVLMSKHILGVDPFTNIYQWLAADVNKSGSVTTFDIVETRKLLLGIYDSFPANTSWRFIRPVPNPTDFNALPTVKDTYQISLPSLNDDLAFSNFNFVGIKIGDTNLSGSFANDADDRAPLFLNMPDRWLAAGETAVVPLRWDQSVRLSGWQLALHADPQLAKIEGVDHLEDDNYFITPDGDLRALWFDAAESSFSGHDPVFLVKIRALQPIRLSEALNLETTQLSPEAYGTDKAKYGLALRFSTPGASESGAALQVFAPYPNPCEETAQLGLSAMEPMEATLGLYDATGKMVWHEKRTLSMGDQTLALPVKDLPAGILAWRLEANGQTFSGRLSKQ